MRSDQSSRCFRVGHCHVKLTGIDNRVLGRVLTKRIVAGTDPELRGEQAGFRKGRNTTEQIFVLRNIIKEGYRLEN